MQEAIANGAPNSQTADASVARPIETEFADGQFVEATGIHDDDEQTQCDEDDQNRQPLSANQTPSSDQENKVSYSDADRDRKIPFFEKKTKIANETGFFNHSTLVEGIIKSRP